MTKHLYIHIPFCNQICSFCDFKRIKTNAFEIMEEFVNQIIHQLKYSSVPNQYSTIYLGGGTPNHLPNVLLSRLLKHLDVYLDKSKPYEFTIEVNPDLVSPGQAEMFHKFNVNRISIGAQILNNEILKQLRRNHNADDIEHAIALLQNNGIANISLDFIYNLPHETLKDLDNIFEFIQKWKIKHISFYALEIKENAILNKQHYQLDLQKEEEQMQYIQQKFKELGYHRYEISNWAIEPQYESIHNKAYWLAEDWKALGYGACGTEFRHNYQITNKILNPVAEVEELSLKDYYFQVLMMGLRLTDGIDISIEPFKSAYEYFKNKLHFCTIKNHHLMADDIDTLNDVLIELLD